MHLVMFASAIAFGLVAGLSKAGDWSEVQVAMLDRGGAEKLVQNPVAAPETWQDSQQPRPTDALFAPQATPGKRVGITLAVTDSVEFWGWGLEAIPLNQRPGTDRVQWAKFQNGIGSLFGSEDGNFRMNVSFRF